MINLLEIWSCASPAPEDNLVTGPLCYLRCHGDCGTESLTGNSPHRLSAMELGKVGFSRHPISSWPLILSFQTFLPIPFILVIYVKLLLREKAHHHLASSFTNRFMEFILRVIRLCVPILRVTVTTGQAPLSNARAVTKPQRGFWLFLKAEALPQGGEHHCGYLFARSTLITLNTNFFSLVV